MFPHAETPHAWAALRADDALRGVGASRPASARREPIRRFRPARCRLRDRALKRSHRRIPTARPRNTPRRGRGPAADSNPADARQRRDGRLALRADDPTRRPAAVRRVARHTRRGSGSFCRRTGRDSRRAPRYRHVAARPAGKSTGPRSCSASAIPPSSASKEPLGADRPVRFRTGHGRRGRVRPRRLWTVRFRGRSPSVRPHATRVRQIRRDRRRRVRAPDPRLHAAASLQQPALVPRADAARAAPTQSRRRWRSDGSAPRRTNDTPRSVDRRECCILRTIRPRQVTGRRCRPPRPRCART